MAPLNFQIQICTDSLGTVDGDISASNNKHFLDWSNIKTQRFRPNRLVE